MQIPLITPALAWLAWVRRHSLRGTVSGIGPLVEGDAKSPWWWCLAATGEHGVAETAAGAWAELDRRKSASNQAPTRTKRRGRATSGTLEAHDA